MAEATQTENADLKEQQNGGFTLKRALNILLLHWPWVIISVILCLGGAYVYLKLQTPTYSASAKLLIKDDSSEGGSRKKGGSSMMNLSEMGIISTTDGFDNELEVLSSTTISNAIVKALNLNVRYYTQGKFTDKELYKCSPVNVSMSPGKMDSLTATIKLEMTPKGRGYHIAAEIAEKNAQKPAKKEFDIPSLPADYDTPVGALHFERDDAMPQVENKLTVLIYPIKTMGRHYASRLSAQASSKTTTVAQLGLVDTEPERAVDYLTQLLESYNQEANADKNEVANKTRNFINERLDSIGQELDSTEKNLEQFKKENDLINLSNDATNALANSTSYQKEQVEIQTQITLVKSLISYVNNPANEENVIPANLGIQDQLLNTQITKYNEARLQYNRLAKMGTENNPAITKLSEEVYNLRASIAQSLRSIDSDLQIQKRSIDSQHSLFAGKISNTPTHERVLNDIGRQQEIKAGLYLTLLQKREENLISLASTATKAKWLDEPQVGGKVSPKNRIIWLIAILLGIALPIAIFYLIELLRYRIEGREDVEKLTKIPLVADIPFTHLPKGVERAVVVSANTNDTMEETFRGLRTNMRFIMGNNQKVVLCTSTIPGEGKTFVCTNLAMSYALLGKKVLVIGLDIRKPQLVRLFKLPSDKRGITNFLADEMAGYDVLEAQIHEGVLSPNLDVMPAGIIPPNPGELISRNRLDEAINYLRNKYDIILLDTPPVGLVSDTLEMGRLADVSIYVCRADYSPKANFELINELDRDKKLPKISLVLNGIDLKKKKYGQYYGTGKYGKYSKHYGRYGIYGNYGNGSERDANHVEK